MTGDERPADVALPDGSTDPALVEYVDHPGNEYVLACPNCNNADEIVAIVRALVEQPLDAVYDVETSAPDYELDPETWAVGETAPAAEIVGVRCAHCRWGYRGPKPLDRLVRQR